MGTSDALFIARRAIEKTWAQKGGKIVLLALDWSKVFDAISPQKKAACHFSAAEGSGGSPPTVPNDDDTDDDKKK